MINQYIKELLNDSNRVIVPDFGAFIARGNADSPDGKIIVFNDILKFNDGLLVNHIITKENLDLTIALQKITVYIQEIHDSFSKGNDYSIEGLGKLHLDKRGSVTLLAYTTIPEEKQPEIKEVVSSTIENKETTEIKITDETPIISEPANVVETIEVVEISTVEVENNIVSEPANSVLENVEIPSPLPTEPEEVIAPPPIPEIEPVAEILETTPPPIPVAESAPKITETIPPIPDVTSALDNVNSVPDVENTTPPSIPETLEQPEEKLKTEQVPEAIVLVEIEVKNEEPKREKLKRVKETPEIKEEPKPEKKEPEQKQKPVKPAAKETPATTGKKKSPLWLTITIWSVSGILFLSLIFMGSVKFGFIKNFKLFSSDEWISTNNKLHQDLEEFNKKNIDKMQLPEINKDDNKKDAFSGADNGSSGSFDTPASDAPAAENKAADTKTEATSSEGSFGSFDTPAESKATDKKESKATTPTNTPVKENKQTTGSSKGKFVLVAGSFKTKDAADRFIIQLKQKGYSSAEYVGESNGMHITCYGSFSNRNEANAELQKLQQKGVQTWILNK